MRWFNRPKKLPTSGQQRRVTRFAWLPTTLCDGSVIWLSWYVSVETWTCWVDYDVILYQGWVVYRRELRG